MILEILHYKCIFFHKAVKRVLVFPESQSWVSSVPLLPRGFKQMLMQKIKVNWGNVLKLPPACHWLVKLGFSKKTAIGLSWVHSKHLCHRSSAENKFMELIPAQETHVLGYRHAQERKPMNVWIRLACRGRTTHTMNTNRHRFQFRSKTNIDPQLALYICSS